MKSYRERLNEPYRRKLATLLTEEQDRRRKIPTSEHEYIRERYKQGESTRELARAYNVSRRLIVFIIHPERLQAHYERKKEQKYSSVYYHTHDRREKHAEEVKRWRHYKKTIIK